MSTLYTTRAGYWVPPTGDPTSCFYDGIIDREKGTYGEWGSGSIVLTSQLELHMSGCTNSGNAVAGSYIVATDSLVPGSDDYKLYVVAQARIAGNSTVYISELREEITSAPFNSGGPVWFYQSTSGWVDGGNGYWPQTSDSVVAGHTISGGFIDCTNLYLSGVNVTFYGPGSHLTAFSGYNGTETLTVLTKQQAMTAINTPQDFYQPYLSVSYKPTLSGMYPFAAGTTSVGPYPIIANSKSGSIGPYPAVGV